MERHPGTLDVEPDALDDADDPYDPTEFIDEHDEFWLRPSRLPPKERFIGVGRSALRRAENIAPRAGRAAIAFGDACDRRRFAAS